MKNLENYGVQVLNTKEIREVDGGIIGIIIAGIALGYYIEGLKEGRPWHFMYTGAE